MKWVNITQILKRFWLNPKDYIYSFSASSKIRVNIEAFDEKTSITALNLVKKLEQVTRELNIYYIGSSALGMPGKNDIDLYIACRADKFENYLPKIEKILGKAIKIRPKFIQWVGEINGHDVETTLIDPETGRFKEQIKIFNLLRDNMKLRQEYLDMKTNSNGVNQREYDRRKVEFFSRMLKNF